MELITSIYTTYLAPVLDILILAYVFYRILLIIKGTRAIQIILGILIILGLTIAVRFLGLGATTWLLEHFWFAAVIIFAVVFQTEIRNLLAQIGGYIGGGNGIAIKELYINEIILAVEDLSASMSGGLIAIENEVGLKNFTETGIMLNANISRELILSIFKNKSAPLHDGAIIINNDKMSAAACLLPLSHDTNVKIFGTRHRAALGLSEITDAIVIVVSEETGQVSVAYKGKLHGDISSQKLKEILVSNGEVLKGK